MVRSLMVAGLRSPTRASYAPTANYFRKLQKHSQLNAKAFITY
ncbi:hypothetical protein [Nostoc edaphicum]|nr:hypothetical protein [Nostoc edaphicum]